MQLIIADELEKRFSVFNKNFVPGDSPLEQCEKKKMRAKIAEEFDKRTWSDLVKLAENNIFGNSVTIKEVSMALNFMQSG